MHVFVSAKTYRINRVFSAAVKYCLARTFTESVTISRNPLITDKNGIVRIWRKKHEFFRIIRSQA